MRLLPCRMDRRQCGSREPLQSCWTDSSLPCGERAAGTIAGRAVFLSAAGCVPLAKGSRPPSCIREAPPTRLRTSSGWTMLTDGATGSACS